MLLKYRNHWIMRWWSTKCDLLECTIFFIEERDLMLMLYFQGRIRWFWLDLETGQMIYLFGFLLFFSILNKHKTPNTLNYDMKVFYFWVGINLYNFIYTQFENCRVKQSYSFLPKYCLSPFCLSAWIWAIFNLC